MKSWLLIPLPLIIYFGLFLTVPKFKGSIIRPWFEPEAWILHSGWIIMYLILGYLLYRVAEADLTDILYKLFILIFLTYCWGFSYRISRKYTVPLIMISMFSAYTVYNAIFLSPLTRDEDSTLELNLISGYIIWLGFVLAIVLSSGEMDSSNPISSI